MNISPSRTAFEEARPLSILPFPADRRRSTELIDVPARRMLHEAGSRADALCRTVSGDVLVSMTTLRGDKAIVAILGPGDLVGLSIDGRYICSEQALTPLTLRKLDSESAPDIHRQLLRQFKASLHRATALTTLTALERLADFFVLWAERQVEDGRLPKEPHEDALDLHLPIQRGELANHLAMTGEHISRSLGELRQRCLIETPNPTTIRIIDFEGLWGLCR